MSDFTGKCVIVTGAAGALGFAVAQRFARGGAKVALLDLAGDAVAKKAHELGQGHLGVPCNLLDGEAVQLAVNQVRAKFGRIDVLCNIAGGFRMGPAVHETGADLWQLMLDMNVNSLMRIASQVVPVMQQQKAGKIVNIGALSALSGKPAMGAYTASKAAVIRLTEAMAMELREQGINVNCVLPSIIDTPANRADMPNADFAKWVTPDALADVIAFLASDAARAVHGAALPVPGLS
jgi:NAD(P)-dependent dehydrogenase (short-subunit alcohol dehydrogenase family)